MSEQEMDEAKARRFQERLERISRRRFMRMAVALSGAASFGVFGMHKSVAQVVTDVGDRCRNTRKLLADNTVNEVFKDKKLKVLLREGMTNWRIPVHLEQLVVDVINAVKDGDELRDFFIVDKISDTVNYPDLKGALDRASEEFSIPFRNHDVDRDEAAHLLGGDDAPFLLVFGNHWFGRFLDKPRFRIGSTDEATLDRAHAAGLLRTLPKDDLVAMGDDECACNSSGSWRCEDSSGDKCSIVEGTPTAGSDLCSIPCP